MRSARVSPNQAKNATKTNDNGHKIAVLPDSTQTDKEEEVKNGNATYPKSILRKETRYPSPAQPKTGFLDFLQRIFNPEFDSPALEKTYRHYFSGQKNASLIFLVIASVAVNFVLIILNSVDLQNEVKLHTTRIIIASLFMILNGAILLLFFCCRRRGPSPILPRLIWIILLLQLILNLILCHSPSNPSDSVSLYIFFIYLTYTLLPFRLYSCIALCVIAAVIHIGITGALAEENFKQNLRYLVCLFINISSISSYHILFHILYDTCNDQLQIVYVIQVLLRSSAHWMHFYIHCRWVKK